MPSAAQYLPDFGSLKNDKGIDLEVCQCSGCGLVQLSNKPVHYYREVIRASAISNEMQKFRRKQFDNFIHQFKLKRTKILEVGCGKGEYLSLLNQLEVDAYGIEYSSKSVDYSNSKDLNVFKGYIDNAHYKIKHSPFNAFLILSFIEHLPNINDVLRAIKKNLIDEGVGLIEVPNFDMIIKKNLFSEFISDHLLYFTKETLKSTLQYNGFEIVDCSVVWYDYIISAIVKKSNTYPIIGKIKKLKIKNFNNKILQIKDNIEKYISKFENKNIAIWGASHQAFTLLSILNLSNKILFVVDSSPFKQNKYTPATHIPIVSPSEFNEKNIDSVIVMAASYSDEVANILIENYKNNFSISVLRENGLEIIR